jgi:hypothetical protein
MRQSHRVWSTVLLLEVHVFRSTVKYMSCYSSDISYYVVSLCIFNILANAFYTLVLTKYHYDLASLKSTRNMSLLKISLNTTLFLEISALSPDLEFNLKYSLRLCCFCGFAVILLATQRQAVKQHSNTFSGLSEPNTKLTIPTEFGHYTLKVFVLLYTYNLYFPVNIIEQKCDI